MIEHIIRTERATLSYRLLAVVAIALGLYWQRETVTVIPTVVLITAYLTYQMLVGRVILPRTQSHYIVYVLALVDTIAVSAGLYLSGGPEGVLFFLFPLFIVYYAMFSGYRSALFSAITFSLAYAGLFFLHNKTGEINSLVAVQIPFLFLVAILAGYLSARRLEERRENEALQEFIRVHTHAQNLLEMARTLMKSSELTSILHETTANLPSIVGFPYCLLALWDKEQQKLTSPVVNQALQDLGKKNWRDILSKSDVGNITEKAVETGTILISDEQDKGDITLPAWARDLSASPLLVVPVQARGEKLGVAYLFDTGPKHSPTEKELKLVKSYVELSAEAISNAQLYGKAQNRIKQLAGDLESTVQRLDRLKEAHRNPQLIVGELSLDGVKERAYIGKNLLSLSPTEFELLYVLAENAGQPVNQETLLRRVWSEKYQGQGNVVDVSVHRLRRKLEGDSPVQRIITVRGRGYMLLKNPLAPHDTDAKAETVSR